MQLAKLSGWKQGRMSLNLNAIVWYGCRHVQRTHAVTVMQKQNKSWSAAVNTLPSLRQLDVVPARTFHSCQQLMYPLLTLEGTIKCAPAQFTVHLTGILGCSLSLGRYGR
jgi:hypothetical protein